MLRKFLHRTLADYIGYWHSCSSMALIPLRPKWGQESPLCLPQKNNTFILIGCFNGAPHFPWDVLNTRSPFECHWRHHQGAAGKKKSVATASTNGLVLLLQSSIKTRVLWIQEWVYLKSAAVSANKPFVSRHFDWFELKTGTVGNVWHPHICLLCKDV